jgi:hydroxymethylpyrimidine/phosphomethylpyrimidine kinase
MTIAGSDSGSGAGVQADARTFAALGVFGTSIVTAITAQNTLGVLDVYNLPAEVVVAQISAVLSDIDIRSVKTGDCGHSSRIV